MDCSYNLMSMIKHMEKASIRDRGHETVLWLALRPSTGCFKYMTAAHILSVLLTPLLPRKGYSPNPKIKLEFTEGKVCPH